MSRRSWIADVRFIGGLPGAARHALWAHDLEDSMYARVVTNQIQAGKWTSGWRWSLMLSCRR
jgi:hypothetical protein